MENVAAEVGAEKPEPVQEIQEENQDDSNLYGGVLVGSGEEGGEEDEVEPEDMNNRVLEMEEELNALNSEQNRLESQISSASDKLDENSVYVGQVDYASTPDDLRAHFAPCGVVNRITILCDKRTGQAKG